MVALPTLADLFTPATVREIYDSALELAETLGLPVTTWIDGDPTRSEYWVLADRLAVVDRISQRYVGAGFLDLAAELAREDEGFYPWLVLLAEQVYGYEAREATSAATTVTLTNNGGAFYDAQLAAGNLTFRSSTTGKTYTNTNTGGEILASGPGTTVDITVAADEPGSDSSAAAGEIDELVTALQLVSVSNASAAVGLDAEEIDSIVRGCRNKLGPLSPNGPADAYDSIATDPDKTGTTAVTRSRTYDESDTGDVTQYVAGPSGAVASEVVDLVEAAVIKYAVPLAITYIVASAVNLTQSVTYTLWVYDSIGLTEAEIKQAVADALLEHFRQRPIGGDVKAADTTGRIYRSAIDGTIRGLFGSDFVDVVLAVPATDTAVGINQVPVLGTVTATVNFEKAPG
jgi:hypothetical protein